MDLHPFQSYLREKQKNDQHYPGAANDRAQTQKMNPSSQRFFFAMRAVSCRVHHSLWLEFLEQVGLAVIRGEGKRKGMWELLQTQLQTVGINLWLDATAAVWELQGQCTYVSKWRGVGMTQSDVEVWEITFLCQINSSAHLVIERFVIYGLKWYLKERFGLKSTSR